MVKLSLNGNIISKWYHQLYDHLFHMFDDILYDCSPRKYILWCKIKFVTHIYVCGYISYMYRVESNQISIVITLFRLIWHQIEFRFNLTQCEYAIPNSLWVAALSLKPVGKCDFLNPKHIYWAKNQGYIFQVCLKIHKTAYTRVTTGCISYVLFT